MAARHNPYSQRAHETIVSAPGTLNGADISLDTLADCQVFIMDFTQAIYVDDCTDCVIRIGPVSGFVFMRSCKNCIVSVACRQFRVKECDGMTVFLYAARDPHLELSRDITIGPYNFAYPLQDQHFKSAGLDPAANLWSQVYDHTPAKEGKNWVVLDKEDFHPVVYEIEGLGQPIDPVIKPSLFVSGSAAEPILLGSQVHSKKLKFAEKWDDSGPDIIQEVEEAEKPSDAEESKSPGGNSQRYDSFQSPSARGVSGETPRMQAPQTPDPRNTGQWNERPSVKSDGKEKLYYPQGAVTVENSLAPELNKPQSEQRLTQHVVIHFTRYQEFAHTIDLPDFPPVPLTITLQRASDLVQPYHDQLRTISLSGFCLLLAGLFLLLALILISEFVEIHNGSLAIQLFLLIVFFIGLLVWVFLRVRKVKSEGDLQVKSFLTGESPAYQASGCELSGDMHSLTLVLPSPSPPS